MDRERETKILADYESVLADAERDIAELRTVINILRKRVKANGPVRGGVAVYETVTQAFAASTAKPRATYGGRLNVPTVILDFLSDGQTRTNDEVFRAVVERMPDRPPSRGSVSNRLNELAARDELQKLDRKHYRLAPENGGDKTHALPGGPNSGGQPGVEESPGEGLITSRLGHRYSVEGVPDVVHQAGV